MAIPVIDAKAFPLNVVAQLSFVVAVGIVLSATPVRIPSVVEKVCSLSNVQFVG